MTTGYEPRFDHDLDYGGQGELIVAGTIHALRTGNAQVEDKRKRRLDNRFYFETEQDPRRQGAFKPSGINTSTADLWAFVIGDTGCVLFIPTQRIRDAIAAGYGRPVAETDGDNPTRGHLLSFNEIIAAGLPAYDVLPGTSVLTVAQLKNRKG